MGKKVLTFLQRLLEKLHCWTIHPELNCIAMSEVKVMELFKLHFDQFPNSVKDQMRREMELLRVGNQAVE